MYWNISPSCEVNGGQVAYLTDNSSGNYGSSTNGGSSPLVTIYTPINSDGTLANVQLWYPIWVWSSLTSFGNFVLLNVGTNNLIQFNLNEPGNIYLVEDSSAQETDINQSSPLLNCGGKYGSGDIYTAIRPSVQTGGYNLNVNHSSGIVNGNEVQFYQGWNASSNEIWTFNCGNIEP